MGAWRPPAGAESAHSCEHFDIPLCAPRCRAGADDPEDLPPNLAPTFLVPDSGRLRELCVGDVGNRLHDSFVKSFFPRCVVERLSLFPTAVQEITQRRMDDYRAFFHSVSSCSRAPRSPPPLLLDSAAAFVLVMVLIRMHARGFPEITLLSPDARACHELLYGVNVVNERVLAPGALHVPRVSFGFSHLLWRWDADVITRRVADTSLAMALLAHKAIVYRGMHIALQSDGGGGGLLAAGRGGGVRREDL